MGITIQNLSKKFGDHIVLNNVSLNVEQGQCYWLIGKNGAGKSTLINIIADFVAPEAGYIFFGDNTYHNNALGIKQRLGVLPEKNPAIPQLTGREYLHFVGLLHELSPEECQSRSESLIAYFFDASDDADKSIATYSHGMTKKIGLCAALIHRPQYLVLDEPFAGLDPISGSKLVQFLRSYRTPDRCIFLSSHDLSYSQQTITHLGILDGGSLLFNGSLEEFQTVRHTIEESILQLLQPANTSLTELGWLL